MLKTTLALAGLAGLAGSAGMAGVAGVAGVMTLVLARYCADACAYCAMCKPHVRIEALIDKPKVHAKPATGLIKTTQPGLGGFGK